MCSSLCMCVFVCLSVCHTHVLSCHPVCLSHTHILSHHLSVTHTRPLMPLTCPLTPPESSSDSEGSSDNEKPSLGKRSRDTPTSTPASKKTKSSEEESEFVIVLPTGQNVVMYSIREYSYSTCLFSVSIPFHCLHSIPIFQFQSPFHSNAPLPCHISISFHMDVHIPFQAAHCLLVTCPSNAEKTTSVTCSHPAAAPPPLSESSQDKTDHLKGELLLH